VKAIGLLTASAVLWSSVAGAQDAMQYKLRHLEVLAENEKVRVLKYTPMRGEKTPMHSHPDTIVYVIKGGGIRITMPDGTSTDAQMKAGDAQLRPPVTHADEALDDLEAILIELKQ